MTGTKHHLFIMLVAAGILARPGWAQTNELTPVVAKPVARTIALPGEFLPFLSVSVHSRVTGYVERVLVDRGSIVKQGDLVVELSAPEMKAQVAEAQSKVQVAEAERLQAEAQLAVVQSSYRDVLGSTGAAANSRSTLSKVGKWRNHRAGHLHDCSRTEKFVNV